MHASYHMIFELADGGNLRKHLEQYSKYSTWKDKYKFGLEITNGLKHLHDLDIIHKDLVFIDILIWVCIVNNCQS